MATATPAEETQEQFGIPGREYQVIGTRPIRPDGTDKVTGRALYGADLRLPGRLYGAVLRSPHAHARILAIDTKQAQAFPGVRAVVTSADLAEPASKIEALGEGSVNLLYQSANILARDKALYHEHAIAAVAATSLHIARQALALIDVTYEVLQPVLDVQQARQPEAPILLENLHTNEMGRIDDHPSNIASHLQFQRGDLEKGFQEAAVIVECEFTSGTVHQGYIEPHNATAFYNADGQLTVWCSTQGAFGVRDQVANILQIPVSKIKVVPMEIGGGFGGKIGVYLEPIAALLSWKSGHQPDKMNMSYDEVLTATGPTSASTIRVKIGASATGKITAAEANLAYAAGAFPGAPVWGGAYVIFGPYCIDNLLIDGYDIVVNRPKTEAYRAPGGSNAAFACETVLDEICESLGMDPLEFRLLNVAKKGDRRVDGVPYDRIGFVETIEAARNHPHYTTPLSGRHLGRGVAAGFWMGYGGKSSASASVNPDGTINLIEGSVDIGGSRASIAMQLAETLGLTIADIRPVVADTDAVGYTEGIYGSRTTFATGWAAYELGMSLRQQLIERATDLWELDPEQVRFENGVFAADSHKMTFKQLAAELHASGSPITASVAVQAHKEGPGIGVHIVDVEVDPETGKVQILRYTAVQDACKAVHPSYVEGQIQGGVAQGVGWALNEEYIYGEQGHLLNASLLDYRLPTCLDLPMIDTVIVEVPNPSHPYGVRGVGEIPIVPPPAAIANAIHQALGVRMSTLPMSPARLLKAV